MSAKTTSVAAHVARWVILLQIATAFGQGLQEPSQPIRAAPFFAFSGSTNRSSPGSGSLLDPYGIASAADFQLLLDRLPDGAEIVLQAGIYNVGAGLKLRKSVRIRGSGERESVLRLDDGLAAQGERVALFGDFPDDNPNHYSFENLTIDANWRSQSAPNLATIAIGGFGRSLTIQNLTIRNCGNNREGEVFYVAAFSQNRNAHMTAKIDAVDFLDDTGSGPSTALHIGGQGDGSVSGFVTNCTVRRSAGGVGIGISRTLNGVTISGNTISFTDPVASGVGILHDTWDGNDVKIINNTITASPFGIGILIGGGAVFRNYKILDNTVWLPPSGSEAVRLGKGVVNCRITENRFLGDKPSDDSRAAVFISDPHSTATLSGNLLDSVAYATLMANE